MATHRFIHDSGGHRHLVNADFAEPIPTTIPDNWREKIRGKRRRHFSLKGFYYGGSCYASPLRRPEISRDLLLSAEIRTLIDRT